MLSGRMFRESDCNRNFRKFSNRNFREFSNRNFEFRKMTLLISRWKLVVQSCMTVMIKSSRDYYCTTNQNKLFQLWFYKVPSCHFRFKITFFKNWVIQKFENFNENGLSKPFKEKFLDFFIIIKLKLSFSV